MGLTGLVVSVVEGGEVDVAGLDPCEMVKKGMTSLSRLGNGMALCTAEQSGLELSLIELKNWVSLIQNAFYP